jgi:hypothetical protein
MSGTTTAAGRVSRTPALSFSGLSLAVLMISGRATQIGIVLWPDKPDILPCRDAVYPAQVVS